MCKGRRRCVGEERGEGCMGDVYRYIKVCK